MAFSLTIKTDNAAFEGGGADEVARLLRFMAGQIETAGQIPTRIPVVDVNGARVGDAFYRPDGPTAVIMQSNDDARTTADALSLYAAHMDGEHAKAATGSRRAVHCVLEALRACEIRKRILIGEG